MYKTITITLPTIELLIHEISILRTRVHQFFFKVDELLLSETNPYIKQTYKLIHKLTKRCGTYKNGHFPIFGNNLSWLWETNEINGTYYSICNVCGEQKQTNVKRGVVEFTLDSIREDRKKYFNSVLQPYRQGEFSKEFKDAYPEISKDMVKEGAITESQYKKAKNVWSDLPGWSHREKTL